MLSFPLSISHITNAQYYEYSGSCTVETDANSALLYTMLKPIHDTKSRHSLEKRLFNGLSLPPEIWLLIFPNFKSSDLRTVTLVCKPFRYMAQPLLFSVLDVSPFLLSYTSERPMLRHKKYLDRFLERLECYKQPHIAHGVHHCWVSPYTRSGYPPRNLHDDLDPNSIIDILLESLLSFPNLTTLSWHCIDITPNWWSVIQGLNVKNLWLNSSLIPMSQSPLSSVVHLDLDNWPWEGRASNQVSTHEEPGHEVDQTVLEHVIQPDVILSISVPRPNTACHVFAVLSQTISQLRVLKIPFFSISDSKFISALWMCPRLENLCIFSPTADIQVYDVTLDPIPPTCLPCLVNYEGPHTHLLNICHQPLKHVSLWGFYERPALCDPDALSETLNSLAQRTSAGSLISLTVLVISITFDLLESFSAFEYLEHLTVKSHERDPPANVVITPRFHITALYDMIGTIVLPSSLKSIKLLTRLGSDEGLLDQEHQAASFIQAFASQYPKVQLIDISYGIYWTGTYTAKWARIRQNNESLIPKEEDSKSAVIKMVGCGGYSSKSSSHDCVVSTITSSVNPLPLGKLTFTEHRRMILFQSTRSPSSDVASRMYYDFNSSSNEQRPWIMNLWLRLKRLFGKNSA